MLDAIVADLAEPGWCVVPDFLSDAETGTLRAECRQALSADGFRPAGVGSGQARIRSEIRGDHVLWIDEGQAGPALKAVLEKLEALRLAVNQGLFLGLFDVELHFAIYPPSAGYQRHLDRFRDDDRRSLTVILYLNENWRHEDDGACCASGRRRAASPWTSCRPAARWSPSCPSASGTKSCPPGGNA
jgi:SM-20-related protein